MKVCVEGASSPDDPSLTPQFLQTITIQTLLCEIDSKLCAEWENLGNKLIKILNSPIKYERKGLEDILCRMKSPYAIDALFLDIDGGEYQLLEGVDSFRPKIICVEYDTLSHFLLILHH